MDGLEELGGGEGSERGVEFLEPEVLQSHVHVADAATFKAFVERPIGMSRIVVDLVDVHEDLGFKAVEVGEKPVRRDLFRRPEVPEPGSLFLHDAVTVRPDGEPEALGNASLNERFRSVAVLDREGGRGFDPSRGLPKDVVVEDERPLGACAI